MDGIIRKIGAFSSLIKQRNSCESVLPKGVESLLQEFMDRAKTLTPAEKNILKLYINGYDIEDITDELFISIGTARKHNTNINRKLKVSNKEELALYIEFFKRCERLDDLIYCLNH